MFQYNTIQYNTIQYNTIQGVSIIIPTFDRVLFLYATLVCLMRQTIKNPYEIIVVDSGTDNTHLIIQQISNKYNQNIFYIRCKESNRSLLRNLGAKKAKYNTILFLDNDILLPANYLELAYEKCTNKKSVVFGLRKSLARFDINILGEDYLINNFEELDTFPYYNDTREKFLNFVDPKNIDCDGSKYLQIPCIWRFGLSHSMMMSKEFFLATKGFNKKFGKYWGYEDVEYCHRLSDSGANFNFVTETYVYHQPHFSQSVREQKQGNINLKKFLSIFYGYEEELVQAFGEDFDYFYAKLVQIRKQQTIIIKKQKKETNSKSAIYLGWCLTDTEKKENSLSNYHLGICLINYKDKSKENAFICSNFYNFPFEMQFLVIREAFRVCKNIYIEKTDIFNSHSIKEKLICLGFECSLFEKDSYYKIDIIKPSHIYAYNLILSDAEDVSERFILKALAIELIKQGNIVYVEDLRFNNEYIFDDYALEGVDNELLKKYCRLNRVYMDKIICGYELLNKYSFLNERGKKIELLDDTCYFSKNENNISNYYTFSKSQLNEAAYELIKRYAENFNNQIKSPSDLEYKYILVFMENGFYEDGLPYILECFKEILVSSNNDNIKLVIEIPEYKKLMSNNYPLHNDTSKKLKNYDFLETAQNDFILLENTIQSLNLRNKVVILKENFSLVKLLKLINNSEIIICSFVGKKMPVYVIASSVLEKKVVISEQISFQKENKNFYEYKTTKQEVSEYFDIPFNMENIGKYVYLPDKTELLNLCTRMI